LDNFITIVEIEIVWSRFPETVGQAHMQSHFTKITKKTSLFTCQISTPLGSLLHRMMMSSVIQSRTWVFLTGVLRNLRVPPMAAKGYAEWNQ